MNKWTHGDFYAQPVWDDDAGVYITDSNIIGLHVEAETLEKFWEAVDEIAEELIQDNHIKNKSKPTLYFPGDIKSKHTANGVLKDIGSNERL